MMATHLAAAGVTLACDPDAVERTSTAMATIGTAGAARYTFDIDWRLARCPTSRRRWSRTPARWARCSRPAPTTSWPCWAGCGSRATVTYDVNARPAVTGTGPGRGGAGRADGRGGRPGQGQRRGPRGALPGPRPRRVGGRAARRSARPRWSVTRGGDGALWLDREGPVEVESRPVTVADTIGAGDTFGAGLIDALWERGPPGRRATATRWRRSTARRGRRGARARRPGRGGHGLAAGRGPAVAARAQLTGTSSGARREVRVHERHDRGALAAGGRDPLHRAGTDVAGREDAGHGGGQVGRREPVDPPVARDVAAGEHEAVAGRGRAPAAASRSAARRRAAGRARAASLRGALAGVVSSRHSHSSCPSPPPSTTARAGQHGDPLVVADLAR